MSAQTSVRISEMIIYKDYSAGLRSSDLFGGESVVLMCQRIMKFLSTDVFVSLGLLSKCDLVSSSAGKHKVRMCRGRCQ